MCDEKDARRHERLAELLLKEGENERAREHFLEAASIYLLEAEVKRDNISVEKANLEKADSCYRKAQNSIGKTARLLSKQELARECLLELDKIQRDDKDKLRDDRYKLRDEKDKIKQQDGVEKMCGENTIKTLVEIGKKLEKTEPADAAKNYLEAADLLLKESVKYPHREDEFVALANKMYLKAKALKQKQAIGADGAWQSGMGGSDVEDNLKQAQVIKKSENKITFKDIGGLENLKDDIKFKIIEPFKRPEVFKFYNKPIGGGILMYGPPGCGKSLIARATANEAKATFIHTKCSDLKSKFVGETEKNIAELFEKAREKQPTIIFFDEFEALGGNRSEGHSHERSAVAQLLTEMDGMDSKDQQILLLAATNEPWAIDPALRREGRFGRTIFVPEPDLEARKQIFRIIMDKRPVEKIDYDKLAEMTEGFSGADIKGVCEFATDIPLRESFASGKTRKIRMDDLNKGIEHSQSIMDQWFKKAKDQLKKHNLEDFFKDLVEKASEDKSGVEV